MAQSRFWLFGMMAGITCASAALAAPRYVSSTPASDASVVKPSRIEVRVSERVSAQGAAIELTMTAMPGMAHHSAMKIGGFRTELSQDGKSIVATLPRPLPVGTYNVKWKAGAGEVIGRNWSKR